MRDINFFSKSTYLHIPNANNPKVILAIGDKKCAKNSFKLYNPFSKKARIFKKIVGFFSVHFNFLIVTLIKKTRLPESGFITFLNQQFHKEFTSSIYYATLKDKVVIQLQTENKIFGYVKYPINTIGLKNIKNEIKALKILSENNIIKYKASTLEYKKTPFFILPELKGAIDEISDKDVNLILDSFLKTKKYSLVKHPRIKEISLFFKENNLDEYYLILKKIIQKSKEKYFEVYEHGDFAPWNIVKTSSGFSAFDFEYFKEKGLEHLDAIKYHFQVARLLKNKQNQDIYDYIADKINLEELDIIVSVFLIKEIMVAIQQKKTHAFETNMLNYLND